MARRLILDTGLLIDAERGGVQLNDALRADDDVAIAAITVAELRTGLELSSQKVRAARTEFVLAVLETIPVEEYGVAVAEAHGRLLAAVRRAGTPRGAHDLIIAATAIATGRILVSADSKAAFTELPGLDALIV